METQLQPNHEDNQALAINSRICEDRPHEAISAKTKEQDSNSQMTSSIVSLTSSSLASPVDSGVQLLDSESSEMASIMSMSGIGGCESEPVEKMKKHGFKEEGTDVEDEIRESEVCAPSKEGKCTLNNNSSVVEEGLMYSKTGSISTM